MCFTFFNSNEIKVTTIDWFQNANLNKSSDDIILWNVFLQHEGKDLLKVGILGIHRRKEDVIAYELLQIEFLTNQDKYNLEYILRDQNILKENFVEMTRGERFVFPVISPHYHEKDRYIFGLVKE